MTESALLRVIIGLVLVVAAILVSAWLARRAGLTQRGGGNVLKQVASMPVGPRQSIVVVEIENTWLVVGVGPNQLNTLRRSIAGGFALARRSVRGQAGPGAQAPLAPSARSKRYP
jgi:flagellar protein FliO/FliZ